MLADATHRFESARLRVGQGLERATFQESPYPALAIASLLSGAIEQAWPATEKACGRALMEMLVSARQRPWTEAESARGDSLARTVKALEPRLATLINAAHADSSAEADERVQTTRLELLAADAQWSAFAQAMAQEYPITEGQSYPLERVQAMLGEKQAITGWLDFELNKDEYVSWAYVLRHQGPITWVQLPGSAAADTTSPFDRARACREALRSAQDADATVAAFSAARIQPLLPALAGIEDLIIVPTGAMATIPIEALMDDQGRRLGDRFTISYAPSATIYTWLMEARMKEAPPLDQQIASGRALLLGDPPFTPKQRDMMLYEVPAIATETAETEAADAVEVATLRGAVVGDDAALAELPRLRNSRREVQAIEDLSDGPTVLLGPAASEQALVKLAESGDLAGYRTIHLATHAVVDQERPERSCLILSRVDLPDAYEAAKRGERIYDGRLTVQEILQEWKLDADLVTLSACETGLGQDVRGEGLVGFAHAFLQAGARSLLVSLWKVDDRATSLFMTRFYGNLWERQMGKAAALREAKEWLRGYEDKYGQRPYGSPRYWSAFILIGDRG
jgi:CHAT domain-containing protein